MATLDLAARAARTQGIARQTLTQAGTAFSGRVAASLLRAAYPTW
jgi:hypothetical protein